MNLPDDFTIRGRDGEMILNPQYKWVSAYNLASACLYWLEQNRLFSLFIGKLGLYYVRKQIRLYVNYDSREWGVPVTSKLITREELEDIVIKWKGSK